MENKGIKKQICFLIILLLGMFGNLESFAQTNLNQNEEESIEQESKLQEVINQEDTKAKGDETLADVNVQEEVKIFSPSDTQVVYFENKNESEWLCPLESFGISEKKFDKRAEQIYQSNQMYIQIHEASLIQSEGQAYLKIKKGARRIFTVVRKDVKGIQILTYQSKRVSENKFEFRVQENKRKPLLGQYLILVNKENAYRMYEPRDLVSLSKNGIAATTAAISVEKSMIRPLKLMMGDARKNGHSLVVVSGYRSKAKQQSILKSTIAQYKHRYKNYLQRANEAVMPPGYSEHETGLAVDIFSNKHMTFDSFSNSSEAKWLSENAYKYGFILRYPKGKTNITKIKFEPWHFRYVGKEIATYIYQNQLTYEEFIHQLDKGVIVKNGDNTYLYMKTNKKLQPVFTKSDLEMTQYALTADMQCIRIKINQ